MAPFRIKNIKKEIFGVSLQKMKYVVLWACGTDITQASQHLQLLILEKEVRANDISKAMWTFEQKQKYWLISN